MIGRKPLSGAVPAKVRDGLEELVQRQVSLQLIEFVDHLADESVASPSGPSESVGNAGAPPGFHRVGRAELGRAASRAARAHAPATL